MIKNFDLISTLNISIELINAVQSLHIIGYIHRDIKPSNFMIGTQNTHKFYIIDFGLARKYVDKNGLIIPPRNNTGFKGTARYASISSHNNEDLGRRDDLWSIFYIMVEMFEGNLPWYNLSDKEDIKNMKLKYPPEIIIQNFPREFENFVNHLNSLNFEDAPDYDLLKGYLKGLVATNGGQVDSPFPWENKPLEPQDETFINISNNKSENNKKFKLVQDQRIIYTLDQMEDDNKHYNNNSSIKEEKSSVKRSSNNEDQESSYLP